MASDTDVCRTCRGLRREHGPDVRHPFAGQDDSTELSTPEMRERARRQESGPQVIKLGGAQTNEANAIGRLVEIMVGKGELTVEEALYVAGMGPRPEPPSKYLDPAAQADAMAKVYGRRSS